MIHKMLEEWFRETLYRLQPEELRSNIFVLRSAPKLGDMETALFQQSSIQFQWWRVRKDFNIFLRQILFHSLRSHNKEPMIYK